MLHVDSILISSLAAVFYILSRAHIENKRKIMMFICLEKKDFKTFFKSQLLVYVLLAVSLISL